jgi:hypothetical protein
MPGAIVTKLQANSMTLFPQGLAWVVTRAVWEAATSMAMINVAAGKLGAWGYRRSNCTARVPTGE